jgi:hypothetical protein
MDLEELEGQSHRMVSEIDFVSAIYFLEVSNVADVFLLFLFYQLPCILKWKL